MPATVLNRRVGRSNAAVRNQQLIGRAAKHADWAGRALESAARDLDRACGADGNALAGLAEVVHDEATRASNLAEEIGSRRIIVSDVKRAPVRARKHPRRAKVRPPVKRPHTA